MSLRFLDTNPLLRYFTRDNKKMAEQALVLLQHIERCEERVRSSSIVVFETVYTLQTFYRLPKSRIRELLLPVIGLRGLKLPNKQILRHALDLYVDRNLPFANAYNAAEMLARGENEAYTWDTHFDHVEGINRVAPGDSQN